MPIPATKEKLEDIIKRWRNALRQHDTGPLVIAEEVLLLGKNWENYADQVNGQSFASFIKTELNKPLRYFRDRAIAVQKLGEDCRRYMHHQVAVWLSGKLESEDEIKRATWALRSATKKMGGNCLSLAQAEPIVYRALEQHRVVKPKICTRCLELEKILESYGIKFPK